MYEYLIPYLALYGNFLLFGRKFGAKKRVVAITEINRSADLVLKICEMEIRVWGV